MSEGKRHQRSIKNYLLFPKIQMRYSLINAAIATASVFASAAIGFIAIQFIESSIEDDKVRMAAQFAKQVFLVVELILVALVWTWMIIVNILITHRFVGPMIAIRRFFEDLKTKENAKLILREEDALHPLAEYLQSLELEVRVTKKTQRTENPT